MSYRVEVTGHKDDVEDAEVFEAEVVEEARKLVSALDGITSASVSTGHLGVVNLLEEDEGGDEENG